MTAEQLGIFRPRPKRKRGRYRRELDKTVAALRDAGRLDPIDSAAVALNRVIADALDGAELDALTGDESRYTVGTLTARAQSALEFLLTRDLDDDPDDFFADLLPGLRDPAHGDPPD